MRTCERLMDILPTVNPALYPSSAAIFLQAAECITHSAAASEQLEDDLIELLSHVSPHIRELAAEALFYTGDEEGLAIRMLAVADLMFDHEGEMQV